MKPRPFMRYIGVVFIAALLAIAFTNGAHGEEVADPDVNMTCVTSLAADVHAVKVMHANGTPYLMVRHLVLTDPTNRDAARWALMLIVDALYDGRLAPDRAHTVLWGICTIPMEKHGAVPEKDEGYLKQHNEGGQFTPIRREHKDI